VFWRIAKGGFVEDVSEAYTGLVSNITHFGPETFLFTHPMKSHKVIMAVWPTLVIHFYGGTSSSYRTITIWPSQTGDNFHLRLFHCSPLFLSELEQFHWTGIKQVPRQKRHSSSLTSWRKAGLPTAQTSFARVKRINFNPVSQEMSPRRGNWGVQCKRNGSWCRLVCYFTKLCQLMWLCCVIWEKDNE
jgi:hypothetical protein